MCKTILRYDITIALGYFVCLLQNQDLLIIDGTLVSFITNHNTIQLVSIMRKL